MPTTSILFYQEKAGDAPVVGWLNELENKNKAGFANCVGRIRQLQNAGHELRRPLTEITCGMVFMSFGQNIETFSIGYYIFLVVEI